MKRRMWKELRALAPWFVMVFFVGAVAIGLVQWFPPARIPERIPVDAVENITAKALFHLTKQAIDYFNSILPLIALAQTVLLVLASSAILGTEFTHGAIQRLLAQPVSRKRIWFEKLAVLFMMLFIIVAMDLVLLQKMTSYMLKIVDIFEITQQPMLETTPILNTFFYHDLYPFLWEMFMVGVVVIATAPTLSLFLRQTHTTFWASLVAPIAGLLIVLGCLMLIDALILGHHFSLLEWIMKSPAWIRNRPFLDQGFYWQFMVPSIVWSAILYPLGWWKFRRLEV